MTIYVRCRQHEPMTLSDVEKFASEIGLPSIFEVDETKEKHEASSLNNRNINSYTNLGVTFHCFALNGAHLALARGRPRECKRYRATTTATTMTMT